MNKTEIIALIEKMDISEVSISRNGDKITQLIISSEKKEVIPFKKEESTNCADISEEPTNWADISEKEESTSWTEVSHKPVEIPRRPQPMSNLERKLIKAIKDKDTPKVVNINRDNKNNRFISSIDTLNLYMKNYPDAEHISYMLDVTKKSVLYNHQEFLYDLLNEGFDNIACNYIKNLYGCENIPDCIRLMFDNYPEPTWKTVKTYVTKNHPKMLDDVHKYYSGLYTN